MKSNETGETELIIEHALLNVSNLTLAAKVGAAYPRLREEVIHRFLTRLQDEMRKTLGVGWIVEIERIIKSSPYLYVRGQEWPKNVHFGVGSENGCLTWVYVWVTKCGDILLDGRLKESLERLFEPWKNNGAILQHFLDKYRDWGASDTLVEIYDPQEALEYMKALLLAIQQTVAPILDGSVLPVQTRTQ